MAEKSGVGVATIRRLEGQRGNLRTYSETLWKLQTALEEAGVVCIPEADGLGPGVRLATLAGKAIGDVQRSHINLSASTASLRCIRRRSTQYCNHSRHSSSHHAHANTRAHLVGVVVDRAPTQHP